MQPENKCFVLLIRIAAICLVVQVLLSLPMWFDFNREIPLVPAFSFLAIEFGAVANLILTVAILLSLILLFVFPFNIYSLFSFLMLSGLFILEDITRFQPWIFVFGIVLLVIRLKRITGENKIQILLFFLGFLYFWSGFQKLNAAFTIEFFPFLLEPLGLEDFANTHLYFGYIPGLYELLGGIFLLFAKTRKMGGWMLIAMHLFILMAIGPLGWNWNSVIWPWNIAMIFIVYILTVRENSGNAMLSGIKYAMKIPLIFLFALAPVLNYFSYWDNHLSGSLYSGNNPDGVFYFAETDGKNLPASTVPFRLWYNNKEDQILSIDHWIMNEFNAPFYPELRYFKTFGKCMCEKVERKDRAGIMITFKKRFTSEQSVLKFSCQELSDQY